MTEVIQQECEEREPCKGETEQKVRLDGGAGGVEQRDAEGFLPPRVGLNKEVLQGAWDASLGMVRKRLSYSYRSLNTSELWTQGQGDRGGPPIEGR